jgi:hypothetical protein
MAGRKDHDFFAVIAIEDDISSMSKADHPLPEFWRHVFEWTADLRVLAQHLDALPDSSGSSDRGFPAFRR